MTLLQYVVSTLTRYGLQCAFALAPVPAYLPQYWALCKSSQDPILQSKVPIKLGVGINRPSNSSWDCNGIIFAENGDTSCSLSAPTNTQLNSCNSSASSSNTPSSSLSSPPLSGQQGFSPVAILILLLSHTLRLLYCCGSAIVVHIPNDASDSANRTVDEVRLDIVMQSTIMIGVQLFLLSAVTRSRRTAFKKALLSSHSSHNLSISNNVANNANNTTNNTLQLQIPPHDKFIIEQAQTDNLTTDTSKQRPSHISQKPFRWLNRPSQYWNWHSLRQHIEFIILLTISTSGFCRLYLYPHDAIRCVTMFRNISVLLESCLALPQLMLNYKRKDTTGLSLAMVFGWLTGDLMKMGYFLIGNSGSAVFVLGSVFAMGIDLVVVIQIMFWFPTWEVQEMRNRFWFWNKERKEGTKQGTKQGQDKHYPQC